MALQPTRARAYSSAGSVVLGRCMDLNALTETFLTESEERLVEFEQGLVVLEQDPTDDEAIHRIFRAAHTLKSDAAMVGVSAIVKLAHVAESVLSRVREHELSMDHVLTTNLLQSHDCFKAMLGEAARGKEARLDERGQLVLRRLQAYVGAAHSAPELSKSATSSRLRVLRIDMAFSPEIFLTGQDPANLIADLADVAEVVSVTANLAALPELHDLVADRCYVSWRVIVRTDRPQSEVSSVFVFVEPIAQIQITDITAVHSELDDLAQKRLGELLVDEGRVRARDVSAALKEQKRLGEVLIERGRVDPATLERVLEKQRAARELRRSLTIRVDTEKLDRLVNLVGELTIAISQMERTVRLNDSSATSRIAVVEAIEQIGRELQTQVMSVRMVPIGDTFARFKRVSRDLAEEVGKLVVFETSGDETELDKNVSEQLADPLKHMIRNAIAHGIEAPLERVRAGKGDTGKIQLRAMQQQGHIVIEISDDGRGIDPEVVFLKAQQLGLATQREKYTERQLLDLIFLPGFSTASELSEISGRGVGLDVVKRNVSELHGRIEVDSRVGHGTTFRIQLPLTLAIIDGMHVKVGPDTMTFPLSSVVELLSPDVYPIRPLEGKGELVDVRGEYLPVVRLLEVLEATPAQSAGCDPVIVVVESNARRFGVVVDRVIGMTQTVVKPLRQTFGVVNSLDRSYKKVEAVAGATILGDGAIALILDVPGIERMAFGELQ